MVRITDSMVQRQILRDLTKTSDTILGLQTRLATGKDIQKPSDDPSGIVSVLSYRSEISEIEQYGTNMSDSLEWMSSTINAMGRMEDLLLEVEDVGRQASSELLTQQQRDAMAAQVDEYLKELVDLSNSTSRGKYIFGGTETGTSPFIPDATENMTQVTQNPKGISQDLIREVGRSQRVAINVSGADILQPDGSYESGANPAGKDTDAFNVLIELRDALRAGDTDAVSAQVEKLDAVYDRVLERDSMLGATISRVQFSQQRGEDEVLDKTERLSNVEDTDYPKAITDYYAKQNMYNTALQIGAQLIQMSIVNFI